VLHLNSAAKQRLNIAATAASQQAAQRLSTSSAESLNRQFHPLDAVFIFIRRRYDQVFSALL